MAFGDGRVVLADDERLLLLDNLAAQIWQATEAGLSPDEIAEALGSANPADSENIRRDVAALISRWSAEGLLGLEPAVEQSPVRASVFLKPKWAGKWRCRFRNLVVDLAVENPEQARLLGRLFEHFPACSGEVSTRIEVRRSTDGEGVILVDGREHSRTCTVRNVQRALIQLIWPSHPLCALVHAGAVALGQRGACFAGVSGSGKTTLIARLVGQGLTYLADDLTPISMRGQIVPWPMPMSVKLDSWGVLSDKYPALETAPTFAVKGTQARSLKPATNPWGVEPIRAHVLIFPKFLRGGPTQCVRLTQFDALRRLIESGFLLESPISGERVEAALEWLAATPVYKLNYGDVDEAASHVVRFLEEV